MENAEAVGLLKRQAARRPEFFAESGLDQLFSVVIELAAEVSVLRERVFAIEAVAGEHGLPLADLVERWSPDAAQAEALAAMRKAMLQNLFRTIDTGEPPVSYVGENSDPTPPGDAHAG